LQDRQIHLAWGAVRKSREAAGSGLSMKYILVSGGVISGVGKGVVASSLGVILKQSNVAVTSIKIDPYINIDAGTFSPYEHGEVYVLDDGGEVDLDLGNYERFLDVTLHRDNNITTGKIYQTVINKERKGDYLGRTVQVVPHITDAIQNWVERVAAIPVSPDMAEPKVCIIELGGTVGNIEEMPFIEAFRQFQFRVGRENFCSVHVSWVPQPKATGEHKTKPTQVSVREIRGLGISPDIIVCRSEKPIDESCKAKVSSFCHVLPSQVVNICDCPTVYHVPMVLKEHGLLNLLSDRLGFEQPLKPRGGATLKWRSLAEKAEYLRKSVNIALVGKYTGLDDAYCSVYNALYHASLACGRKLSLIKIESEDLEEDTKSKNAVKFHNAWKQLCSCHGVLIPGGFGTRGIEGKVAAAHWARINKIPMLGICLGLQCAVIEFARNVLNKKDANSTEINPDTPHPVVVDMPEHTQGDLGGTMRLGRRSTLFNTDKSILRKLYGDQDKVDERHRHRYEVNPDLIDEFESAGMKFVGRDVDNQRMEIMELEQSAHPYYVAVQYHPEYLSRPLRPSPPFLGLILSSIGKLPTFLALERGASKGVQGGAGASVEVDSDEECDEDSIEIRELVRNIKSLDTGTTESASISSTSSPR